jgi:hypothetical protein
MQSEVYNSFFRIYLEMAITCFLKITSMKFSKKSLYFDRMANIMRRKPIAMVEMIDGSVMRAAVRTWDKYVLSGF